MKLLENKGICIVIMAVLIISGFLLGGWKGLGGQYGKVSDVFFTGEDGDGICIANDMAEKSSALVNMVTLARKYANTKDEAIEGANTAVSNFNAAGSIKDMFVASKEMDAAMELLYRKMGEYSLTEKDESYRQKLYAGYGSRNDTISHDPYYTYAADYNKVAGRFPAALIVALTPAQKAVIAY